MDWIYIAPLSKALYNLCLSFTHSHTFTHQRRLAAMQGANQLIRSNRGLGVSLRDTSTRPGWDRTGNHPTARRQLLPPEPHRPLCIRKPTALLRYCVTAFLHLLHCVTAFLHLLHCVTALKHVRVIIICALWFCMPIREFWIVDFLLTQQQLSCICTVGSDRDGELLCT